MNVKEGVKNLALKLSGIEAYRHEMEHSGMMSEALAAQAIQLSAPLWETDIRERHARGDFDGVNPLRFIPGMATTWAGATVFLLEVIPQTDVKTGGILFAGKLGQNIIEHSINAAVSKVNKRKLASIASPTL